MPSKERIAESVLIDRILDLVQSVPETAEGLPEESRTKAFWRKFFAQSKRTRRIRDMLLETPAFTNQAPAKGDARGWRKVLLRDFAGPEAAKAQVLSRTLHWVRVLAKEVSKKPKKVKYWRDRFGPHEKIQRVRPTESHGYIHNPHRGTTTFQRFQGDETYPLWVTSDTHGPIDPDVNAPARDNVKYIARTTLSYCRWPWRWLEPQKGKYRWKLVDNALKTARKRGQTVQIRFQPYTRRIEFAEEPIKARRHPPERSVNVPDWYWDTGAKWVERGVYAPNEPDSNDPRYLKHFGDFIRAFAKRYDGHEDLESIDMAYAGFWGESGGNTTDATAAKLVDVYLKSFRKTQLLSMLGTAGCAHAAAKTRGASRHIGWRADCFGDLHIGTSKEVPSELSWNHTFDCYPKEIVQCGVSDAWRAAPVTMETCGNVATWFMADYDLDVVMREGYRYHTSVFMPKNVFFPEPALEKLRKFDLLIGYRFVLRQMLLPLECKAGEKMPLQFFIDNVGCAPIYRPYAPAVRFRQGKKTAVVRLKADIRTWMPGHTWFEEKIAVPKGLKKGEAKVDLAILDAKGKPKVWFAIDAPTVDGAHPMTSIDIM